MMLKELLLLIITHLWVSAATDYFYVFPDDLPDISCPVQCCATLSQYLQDNNGTLPVLSNVTYNFFLRNTLFSIKNGIN